MVAVGSSSEPPAGDGAHRADQVLAQDLLEQVAGGPGHDRLEQRLVVAVAGQHDDLEVGHAGAQLAADASRRRRRAAARRARRRPAAAPAPAPAPRRRSCASPTTVMPGIALEDVGDPAADDLVVVEEEDPDARLLAVGIHRSTLGRQGPYLMRVEGPEPRGFPGAEASGPGREAVRPSPLPRAAGRWWHDPAHRGSRPCRGATDHRTEAVAAGRGRRLRPHVRGRRGGRRRPGRRQPGSRPGDHRSHPGSQPGARCRGARTRRRRPDGRGCGGRLARLPLDRRPGGLRRNGADRRGSPSRSPSSARSPGCNPSAPCTAPACSPSPCCCAAPTRRSGRADRAPVPQGSGPSAPKGPVSGDLRRSVRPAAGEHARHGPPSGSRVRKNRGVSWVP